MKLILISINLSIFISSCCLSTQEYPLPNQLKYSSIEIEDFYTCLVDDSSSDGYKTVNISTKYRDTITRFYLSYFNNARIEQIDFLDSFKVKVHISSNGKIVKTIQNTFSHIYGMVDIPNSTSNTYATLYMYSLDDIHIPYDVCTYKKQGEKSFTNHTIATSYYYTGGGGGSIKKFIRDENLKNNDTIYNSYVDLKYKDN